MKKSSALGNKILIGKNVGNIDDEHFSAFGVENAGQWETLLGIVFNPNLSNQYPDSKSGLQRQAVLMQILKNVAILIGAIDEGYTIGEILDKHSSILEGTVSSDEMIQIMMDLLGVGIYNNAYNGRLLTKGLVFNPSGPLLVLSFQIDELRAVILRKGSLIISDIGRTSVELDLSAQINTSVDSQDITYIIGYVVNNVGTITATHLPTANYETDNRAFEYMNGQTITMGILDELEATHTLTDQNGDAYDSILAFQPNVSGVPEGEDPEDYRDLYLWAVSEKDIENANAYNEFNTSGNIVELYRVTVSLSKTVGSGNSGSTIELIEAKADRMYQPLNSITTYAHQLMHALGRGSSEVPLLVSDIHPYAAPGGLGELNTDRADELAASFKPIYIKGSVEFFEIFEDKSTKLMVAEIVPDEDNPGRPSTVHAVFQDPSTIIYFLPYEAVLNPSFSKDAHHIYRSSRGVDASWQISGNKVNPLEYNITGDLDNPDNRLFQRDQALCIIFNNLPFSYKPFLIRVTHDKGTTDCYINSKYITNNKPYFVTLAGHLFETFLFTDLATDPYTPVNSVEDIVYYRGSESGGLSGQLLRKRSIDSSRYIKGSVDKLAIGLSIVDQTHLDKTRLNNFSIHHFEKDIYTSALKYGVVTTDHENGILDFVVHEEQYETTGNTRKDTFGAYIGRYTFFDTFYSDTIGLGYREGIAEPRFRNTVRLQAVKAQAAASAKGEYYATVKYQNNDVGSPSVVGFVNDLFTGILKVLSHEVGAFSASIIETDKVIAFDNIECKGVIITNSPGKIEETGGLDPNKVIGVLTIKRESSQGVFIELSGMKGHTPIRGQFQSSGIGGSQGNDYVDIVPFGNLHSEEYEHGRIYGYEPIRNRVELYNRHLIYLGIATKTWSVGAGLEHIETGFPLLMGGLIEIPTRFILGIDTKYLNPVDYYGKQVICDRNGYYKIKRWYHFNAPPIARILKINREKITILV